MSNCAPVQKQALGAKDSSYSNIWSGMIHEVFEHQAERTPEASALEYEVEIWTYRELNSRANQIAYCLRGLGVGPDVLVGIFLNRSAHLIAGILGILKAGGAYVPLDPDTPTKRVEFMIHDAKMPIVLTERKLAGLVSLGNCKVLCVEDIPTNTPDANLDVSVRPDHLAYIIYTSGSTGNPKGAMVTHHNVVRLFQTIEDLFHFGENDVWTMFHSHAFDFSVWEIWGALFYGGRLVIVPYLVSRSPEAFYNLLCASKVTVLNQTPSAFKQLIRVETQYRDSSKLKLRYVIFGGEALYPHILKPWFNRHGDTEPQLVNMYGITETTVHVTYRPLSISDLEKNSVIGIPLPDLRVYLLDEKQEPVQDGETGEIYVGGEGVARGYLNRPELTSDRFLADPENPSARIYKSGDLARKLPSGELEYLGRADKQIKIRGFRVELGEIEAAIANIDGVQQVAVIAREDAEDDKRIAAYIIPKQGLKIEPLKIRSILGKRLPSYMLPAWFVTVETLPLNHNGKLDSTALPDPAQISSKSSELHPPKTTEEREIAAIWCDVLRLDNVGISDNFFELGGHSLIAVQVISRIQTKFGVEVPLHAVFQIPTISGLAKLVVSASRKKSPSLKIHRNRELVNPPLSFAQQYLWFVHKLAPHSAAYNLPSAIRMIGRLNSSALEGSLNEIIRRHEILRASFPNNKDTPIQVIAPCLKVPLPVSDLSELSREIAEAEIQRHISSDAVVPFDLSTGPLIRFSLLRISDNDHVLVINLHHMVADGWSLTILFKELEAIYEAISEQKPSPLPELSIQYADFAVWQRSHLTGSVYERQLAYWRKQLHGAPILNLPTDHPRNNQEFASSGQESIAISSDLRGKVDALSFQEGATPFMVLLSAFALVLFRRTGQDDICVGSPTAGRNSEELEKLIGFFNNTIVLRTSLEGDPTFRELLRQVRTVCLEAFENQDVPFAKLVEELNPERSGNRTPFFQVFFNLLNYENDSVHLPNLSFQPLASNEVSAKFDLTIYVKEENRTLRFTAVYNGDLFDAPQIVELLRQLNTLLAQAVNEPDQRLSEFSSLTGEARPLLPDPTEELAVKWNGFIHDRFSEQASKHPSKPAVCDERLSWTYNELNRASNRLANALIEQQIRPGDIVAVYGHRSAFLVTALLGILKAGAGFMILDPAYPCNRLAACIAIGKPAAILEIEADVSISEMLKASVVTIRGHKRFAISNQPIENLWSEYSSENPNVRIGPDDVAYMAFTSGSTGTPKSIIGTHRPLSHFVAWHTETFGLCAEDRFSMLSGLSHDPLLRDIFTPLWMGGTLCIPPYENIHTPGWVANWLHRMRITVMHVTPAIVELICESSACVNTQFPDLRYAFFGGDCLTKRHVRSILRHAPGVRCINFYGTTETPQAVSYFVVDQDLEKNRDIIPLGRGISDAQILILNERRQLAGIGEVGEIFVRTPYLSMGYLDDERQTCERFLKNPHRNDSEDRIYRTGDLGRYLPDGTVEFAGRADRQLKIRGFRIEPGEIEQVICNHNLVKQCYVTCLGEKEHRKLIAYVVLSKDITCTTSVKTGLRTTLSEQLPQYAIPDQFVFVDEIPLTPNGKVDFQRLPCPERLNRSQADDLPTNEMQVQLVKIWEDVLGHSPISIRDNFFHIGGHSLLAVRLFVRIKQLTGKSIPLAVLFQAPTIEQLALALSDDQCDSWNTIVPIKPSGKKPPLFCLHAVGGNVLSYHDLAAQLDLDQPVYGLQARGLDGKDIKFKSLEEMASHYIAEIRTVWPKGPYILAGLSTGGFVAYEMAQHLQTQGENVALLVLFDTFPLTGWRRNLLRRYLGHIRILLKLPLKRKLIYARDKAFLVSESLKCWFTKYIATKQDNISDPLEAILEKVREANRRNVNKYRPKDYTGRVILFRASIRPEFYKEFHFEPEVGWRRLIANMEVYPTPGDHGQILANPNVRSLARDLQAYMDRAVKNE